MTDKENEELSRLYTKLFGCDGGVVHGDKHPDMIRYTALMKKAILHQRKMLESFKK